MTTTRQRNQNAADTPSAQSLLQDIFGATFDGEDFGSMKQGLINLKSIPPFFNPHPPAVNGKEFVAGLMGFRRSQSGEQRLAIACGKNQVRYIPLAKYIAMVENLHNNDTASIMLQNFQEADDHSSGRGQVLGRINAASSAITIIQGVTSRIIRGPSDIALFDVYHIDRRDLTAYYIAAKYQISTADQMETMIATFDGWKSFNVPLDPLDPYGVPTTPTPRE